MTPRGLPLALRVALIYALVSVTWILFSDWLVLRIFGAERAAAVQTYKGLCFVTVTALLLWVLIRRGVRQIAAAEAAAREREELFHAVYEDSMDGLFVLDDAGVLQDANGAGLALLGVNHATLAGRPFSDFVTADVREEPQDTWDLSIRSGELTGDSVVLRPDGTRRAVNFRLRRQILPGRHLAVVRDVERQRALEEQLRQAQRMESLGRLAGGVAHDFNNILTAILGHCELLVDEQPAGSPLRQELEEIRSAGLRASALTRQLLAFSRRQVLAPRVVDIGAVVRGLEPLLRRVIGEDVAITIECERDLTVRADPGQVEQVVVNLAVNARDAMPNGGRIDVRVAAEDVLQRRDTGAGGTLVPGRYAVLTVVDTGSGMTPDVLAHLFEPFYTTKQRGHGSGLGLSTVYGIVSQSGGVVRVVSEPGRGSTFRVYLPGVTEPADAGGVVPEAISPALDGSETVLLVEDEEAVRSLVQRTLSARGYRVLASPAGPAALEMSDQYGGTIHALVTDVVMPGMSGPQLADALRRRRPEVRVVFMSGYAEDALGQRGPEARDAFLPKPFTPDVLARTLRQVLDHDGAGR